MIMHSWNELKVVHLKVIFIAMLYKLLFVCLVNLAISNKSYYLITENMYLLGVQIGSSLSNH